MRYGAKRLIVVLFFFTYLQAAAQTNFKINGRLHNLGREVKIMLIYNNGIKEIRDSAFTKNGAFTFSGVLIRPVKATMELKPLELDTARMSYEKYVNRDLVEFYLSMGNNALDGTALKTARIQGSETQRSYDILQLQLKPLKDQLATYYRKIYQYRQAGDKEAIKALEPVRESISSQINQMEENFILKNGDSYVALDLVKSRALIINPIRFEPLYAALSDRLKGTPEGIEMGGKLAIAKKVAIGQSAIDFTQGATEGKAFTLSSLKGKYVLVDFWASWCGPCRRENPNLLTTYNDFKNQDFKIVGVSLDHKKSAWLDAIKKDGLPWIQVCDLKGWENDAAVKYGVKAVPQNFLLDPTGKIISLNLGGAELRKELSRIFN